MERGIATTDMIERVKQEMSKSAYKPIEIDGRKHYIMMVHPANHYTLRVIVAKDKYKHEQWVPRYNKWRASQGLPDYVETEPEHGTTEGIRFIGVA